MMPSKLAFPLGQTAPLLAKMLSLWQLSGEIEEERSHVMANDPFDSLDPLEPPTLRQAFALAQATEPGVVLMYEREREKPGKERLDAFVHQGRAWLYYWQVDEYEGYDDVGFRSYDPFYQGEADALFPYTLDNGQVDEYPCSWTISVDEAIRAVEHFLEGGSMAPWVHWCKWE